MRLSVWIKDIEFTRSPTHPSTPFPLPPFKLEESNRTLTVDVGNLAGEKEELNNQLKDMQQRECC